MQDMTDAQLFTLAFQANQELFNGDSELSAARADELAGQVLDTSREIERRFGEGANDRLASWFTASKASADDMIDLAVNETAVMAAVAREGMKADPASKPISAAQMAWADRQFYGHA